MSRSWSITYGATNCASSTRMQSQPSTASNGISVVAHTMRSASRRSPARDAIAVAPKRWSSAGFSTSTRLPCAS
eukprot:6488434-Prymnesium_polylepis.1